MRNCIALCLISIVLTVSCKMSGIADPVNVSENTNSPNSAILTMGSDGGDNSSEISIANSWIHDTGDITLTFSEGDVYTYIFDDGDSQYQEYGTYSVSDSVLNAKDSDGYSFSETVEVEGNILTLRDEYGYSQSFSRLSLI